MKELKLALAQLNPTVGDIQGNAQKIICVWQEQNNVCDLILFPELFLCGYPPEDLVQNYAFLNATKKTIKFICEHTKDFKTAALVPTIWEVNNDLYNAALLIERGKIKSILKKNRLPNYSVFDEERTFHRGPLPEPIDFRGYKLGIMICEDAWYEDVPMHLKKQGAELLISINASPFYYGQGANRRNIMGDRVKETGLNLIYLNMVGGQDELVFDGRSFFIGTNPTCDDSEPCFFPEFEASAFKEDLFFVHIGNSKTAEEKINFRVSKKSNLGAQNFYDSEYSLIYEALKLGLKDYVHKNGFDDVIIGLSGGIDSALTASIAVDALGPKHVRCIMLPSEFTSLESLEDAKQCADILGVSYDVIPINAAVNTFESIIPGLDGVAHENTQSRIRGLILMAISNISGSMLVTTGNKSEMAVGYCTLYGDMNGGFNILKDVYKTEVYALAKWRNKSVKSSIPKRIISKQPSAELRADQKDQDSLPPYALLDDILKMLIEHDEINWSQANYKIVEKKKKCEKHPDIVKKVAKLLKNSEYKRFQAAPGPRITFRAFGRDRRYPMTNHFVNVIDKSQ